jgi:hypothetical protein
MSYLCEESADLCEELADFSVRGVKQVDFFGKQQTGTRVHASKAPMLYNAPGAAVRLVPGVKSSYR